VSVAGGCGFCLVNHACVGALHAHRHFKAKTAIVDIDVHHGNGTQEIVLHRFENDNASTRGQILYTSIHLADRFVDEPDLDFFPGSGVDVGETPTSDGQTPNSEMILNVPIMPTWDVERVDDMRGKKREAPVHLNRSGRRGFRELFAEKVIPKLRAFAPELVIMSSGFDAAGRDEGNMLDGQPGMDLLPEDYEWVTQQVLGVCTKVVSVLEGGYGAWDECKQAYDRSLLSECAMAHVRGLASDPEAASLQTE
jgi:acetoin utilization deacetylase AcuC-like enzyme